MTELVDASLVLTVLNEERSIGTLLASLGRQDYLPKEVLIVDGGSTDGTGAVVGAWERPDGVSLRLVEAPGASIARGRNLAISLARFDSILVTDGGATLDDGWVRALAGALEAGAEVASGFFRPVGTRPIQRIIGSIITPTLDEIRARDFLPSSRSVGFKREALEKVGMYPEWLDYCEDLVLDLALRGAGAKFVFVPEAVVTWDARPSLSAFAKQYYRYARGDAVAGLWPRRHAARFGAYAAGLLAVAGFRHTPRWVWLSGAAAGLGYLSKPARRVFGHAPRSGVSILAGLPMVPIVVAVGDVAKMAGYIAGLMRTIRARSAPNAR